jgi:hypothetical protein
MKRKTKIEVFVFLIALVSSTCLLYNVKTVLSTIFLEHVFYMTVLFWVVIQCVRAAFVTVFPDFTKKIDEHLKKNSIFFRE